MGGSLAAPDSGFVPPLAGVPLCMCLPSIFPGAARSSPSCCVFQKVGESAILPRLTATDGITSKQRLRSGRPAFNNSSPKSSTSIASHSHLPIFNSICLCIRLCGLIFIFIFSVYSIVTLQRSSVPPAFAHCAIAKANIHPAPLLAGRIELLPPAASCSSPPASSNLCPSTAQHSARTNLWLQRGSGCLLRASISEKTTCAMQHLPCAAV